MKHVLFATLAVGVMLSTSGCSAVGAWANRMGEKMPVYGDESNRCEGYFCFGKKNENTARKHQKKSTGKRKLYDEQQGDNPYAAMPQQGGYPPQGYVPLQARAGQVPPSAAGGYGGLPPGMIAPPGAPTRAPMPGEQMPDFDGEGDNFAPVEKGRPAAVPNYAAQPNYAPVVRGRQGQGGYAQGGYPPQGYVPPQAAVGQVPVPSSIPRMSYDDELEEEGTFNPDLYRPEAVEARAAAKKKLMMKKYKDAGLKEHEIYQDWQKDMPEGPLGTIRKDVGW